MLSKCVWLEFLFFLPRFVSSWSGQQYHTLIQNAMKLTKQGAVNITAAQEAVELWKQVPKSNPSTVQSLINALHASCLARLGQDHLAISVFSDALELNEFLDENTRNEVILGRAKSLQRMLRYQEAKKDFSRVNGAAVAEATCDMRLGNLTSAMGALSEAEPEDDEATILLEILCWMASGKDSLQLLAQRVLNLCIEAEQRAGTLSPLFKWLCLKHGSRDQRIGSRNTLIDYCMVNNGPLDDPLLLQLDDKVLLHRLLANDDSTRTFWPCGEIICIDDVSKLAATSSSQHAFTWICKRRSGYGSHGNQIVRCSTEDAKSYARRWDKASDEDCMLLQRMVEPPLLANGRKFSLRVYAVIVGNSSTNSLPNVYLSREGLVKLAAKSFQSSSCDDPRMHMTNSGRELDMQQTSFDYLRRTFPGAFDQIWKNVKEAVVAVMRVYYSQAKRLGSNETALVRNRLASLGTPKILGFDFVLDASHNAWLVEVNRFPGLEPRNEMDEAIKCRIVRDAWYVASASEDEGRMISVMPFVDDFEGASSCEIMLDKLIL